MDIADEFEGCDLGHERREKRLLLMLEALQRAPEMSFPEAFGYGKHLEGAYRFFNNEAITAEKVSVRETPSRRRWRRFVDQRDASTSS